MKIRTQNVSILEGSGESVFEITYVNFESDNWWEEFLQKGYYMDPGTYTIKLYNGDDLVIEGQFEIR